MSAKDNVVTVGGEPRIDFLPPEIQQKKQSRRAIRGLVLLVGLVLAVCVAAYAGATTFAIASQVTLAAEQDRTQALLREQQQFSEALFVSGSLQATKDALKVASATEVKWVPYFGFIAASLPADSVVTELSVDQQTATEAAPSVSEGIESPRTGTITVKGTFASLSGIAEWLESVTTLPGFAGYTVSQSQLEDGRYSFQLSIHINADATERRFFDVSAPTTGEDS